MNWIGLMDVIDSSVRKKQFLTTTTSMGPIDTIPPTITLTHPVSLQVLSRPVLARTQPTTNPVILVPIPQLSPEVSTPCMPLKRLRPRRPPTQSPQLRRCLVVRHLLIRRRSQILPHP